MADPDPKTGAPSTCPLCGAAHGTSASHGRQPRLHRGRTISRATALLAAGIVLLGGIGYISYRDMYERAHDRAVPSPRAGYLTLNDAIKISIWNKLGGKADVVMVGDSHTEMFDWQTAFADKTIANRGVRGDTTRSVLARLDTIFSVSAKLAVVMLGTNDVLTGSDAAEIARNYLSITDQLLARGLRVIVVSTPFTDNPSHGPVIEALNDRIARYCAVENCLFLDLNARVSAGRLLRPDRTVDGIHLNGDGYADWISLLASHL